MSLEQVIAENTKALNNFSTVMQKFLGTLGQLPQDNQTKKVETVKEEPPEETKETILSNDDLLAEATKVASAYAKAFDVKALVAVMRDRYGGKAHIDSLSKEQQEDLIAFCQKALS